MQDWHKYAQIAIALFLLADPVGAIPIFLALTKDQTREERKHTALVAAGTVAAVLLVFAFAGVPLLQLFGIRIASFRVGGGILILMMAISMMFASPAPSISKDAIEAAGKHDLAVVPLGVPLIAGPGVVSSVIVYAQQVRGAIDQAFLVLIIGLLATSIWIALRLAEPTSRLLGRNGINVIVRLMGLLLAAIATEFISIGLVQLLPGLAARASRNGIG
jgi:multiple antibiotic resistance protein